MAHRPAAQITASGGTDWSRFRSDDLAAFRAENNKRLASLKVNSPRPEFSGRIEARFSDPGRAVCIHASDVDVARTDADIAADGVPGSYKLLWQISGTGTMEQRGSVSTLRPGDTALYSLTQPYTLSARGDYRALILGISVAHGDADWIPRDWVGGPVIECVELAAVRSMLTAMFRIHDEDSHAVLDCAHTLALSGLRRVIHEAPSDQVARRLPMAWVQLITASAADPDFSPARLARAVGHSRRSLYYIFAEAGTTPAAYIRDVRLDQCRRILSHEDPSSRISLSALAHDHGFRDAAQFSRAFNRAFGVPPSRYRIEVGRSA